MPSLAQRLIVDDAVLAYVEWREESSDVWDSYRRWRAAPSEDAGWAHAAHVAALDREQAAANAYAESIRRVGDLLKDGWGQTPIPPG